MKQKQEKIPNALTSKENLGSPHLVKNFKERTGGRDVLDMEGKEFFDELVGDIEDLKMTDDFLQVLLLKRFVTLHEPVSSAREKINERIKDLEDTLEALRGRFARNPKIKHDEIDDEFERLSIEEKDNIEEELERLGVTYKVLGHFLRAGIFTESDTLMRAKEAVYNQIKKFTP
ncbi:MAG: hypothetical protein A2651_03015 [Candidatus Yanofskybacteria bacterium RIFCSPHIGHO2_01_FULL_42_12]|uniref:Uncharacterized protein n=1 Tax=Candidatus Yanofskybacteria bacterium RIFCSPLOWO2_01_FULL_42_49 TaxID=1802694 RepID=A0A1F8GBA4_9BACT|nr:MAG: hypothetical protein A2651_03015 [Candidatus Yanofskybacteria bacterium RIFCSPHIGHO2_01_FULL_42_12]OGN22320.1 MAG: hypothetical protein A2918_00155 [Candidatus Yanofskybacteria bacterium RIFCSPLOWO2_01_FULL_42_49]